VANMLWRMCIRSEFFLHGHLNYSKIINVTLCLAIFVERDMYVEFAELDLLTVLFTLFPCAQMVW
jgi:hypothetical protein